MTHEKETECYLTNLIYRVYKPNAFGSTFAFFQPHKAKQKCKRATKPTHHDKTRKTTRLTEPLPTIE